MSDPPHERPPATIDAAVAARLKSGESPNRLIREKSPYLLQHAFNPVDWFPWGPEAFEKAKRENKVVFLSVGYSTCYWCHVMEREVFEDPAIASLMNELAVNIKVDREERPDVDRVYMSAVQAMTGSGGWPMSVFLTPGLEPFYGATYIPPVASGNRPGFPDLLRRIAETWKSEPHRITDTGRKVVEFMRSIESPRAGAGSPGPPGDAEAAERTCALLESAYDKLNAGFGAGPKFPRPCAIDFLLEHHRRTGRPEALAMAVATLRRMASGGMYDHVGGGFHRYSVDGEWRVPHFEKMLYDQAQLVNSYLSAYQVSGDASFAGVALRTLEYVRRNLRDPAGGFHSAEDAESAPNPAMPDVKEEGAFYVWTADEIRRSLGDAAGLFCRHFGVREEGNASHDPLGVFVGKNILYRAETMVQTSAAAGLTEEATSGSIAESLALLAAARMRRPRPVLDDKIITGWNGLMISAAARSGRILGRTEDVAAARAAADFVLDRLVDARSGRLSRRYRDGEARFDAGLQDYAFLVGGLLDLYDATFDPELLRRAIRLTEIQIELFRDPGGGGFFDTPGDDPSIIIRTKEEYDGAEPAGNSAAALNLWRVSMLTDNSAWRSLAEETASYIVGRVGGRPDTAPMAVTALGRIRSGGIEIVIAGEPGADDTAALLAEVNRRFLPDAVLMFLDGGKNQAELETRLPFLKEMTRIGGRATAYVCRNYACTLPVTEPSALGSLLDQTALTTPPVPPRQ